jgi:hypothetical protein
MLNPFFLAPCILARAMQICPDENCQTLRLGRVNDHLVVGSSLLTSTTAQVSRLHRRRGSDAGDGYRRKRRCVQRSKWGDPAPAECAAAREPLFTRESASDKNTAQSYPDYLDFRDRNHSFDGLAAFGMGQLAINTGEGPSVEWNVEASCNYFDALHIQPFLGRFFHDSDDHGPNSAPYMVLSYDYWHSHFQDDRGVGRVVQLNEHPFTIIGVAPPEFRGTIVFFSPNFWVPIENHEQIDAGIDMNDRGSRWLFMSIGHL